MPDDFDRRDDQGIWTGQYAREGQYPPKEPITKDASAGPKKPVRAPVRGSIQLQIADNDKTAEETHDRMESESEMRQTVTDEERLHGAEQARKWLDDNKK